MVRMIKKQHSMKSLKGYLFKNKLLFLGTIIFSILIAGLNIAVAFILKTLIDIGVDGKFEELINLVAIVLVFLVLYLVFNILHYLMKNNYLKKALASYKDAISKIIINKNLADFRKKNTGSYISVISNDVKTIETDYVAGNLIIITQVALFIMGLAAMFYLNVLVAVVVILLSALPIISAVVFNGKVAVSQQEVSEKNENFTTTVKDVFNGFTVIKSFGVENEVGEALSRTNNNLEMKKRKFNNITDLVKSLTEVSGFIVVIGTFTFGTWLAIQGTISVGEVVAYIQLLNYLLGPIVILSEYINKRKAGLVLVSKIDNMLLSDAVKEEGIAKENFESKIRFEDVSFTFDGEQDIVSNLNLELEKNKSYAVVGLSGSGKSTLLNLLMGYYETYRGNIFVDDTELKEIDPSSLYKMISVIQQEVFMFDAPIENNIMLYKPYSDGLLDNSIELSGLAGFINRKGTEFNCGENGSFLSGGEKQRVSIARALIKGTPILLLDEATSSLDNETALAIEKSILNINNITRVIVTHKLNESMLSMYDEIIMMKNGKVVEKGSFNDLIEKRGVFYSLYKVTD